MADSTKLLTKFVIWVLRHGLRSKRETRQIAKHYEILGCRIHTTSKQYASIPL